MVEPLIPRPPRRPDGRGRPRRDPREVLNAILWILRTGAPWHDLPHRYPAYQTCHRRFQKWVAKGALESVLATLARHLRERGELDLSECFVDATFVTARSGGDCVGATKRGKGTKLIAVADSSGLPMAMHAASATPHEVTLVKETLQSGFAGENPERLIGDRAYDSDPLDASLHAEGIEMIAPHRKGRKKEPTQDGRKLRRYKRRWKVERLFAWLSNIRRLVVGYERRAENYLGFVHLGCMVILLSICEMASRSAAVVDIRGA
jgi:transposase